jgi:hypothetical protein
MKSIVRLIFLALLCAAVVSSCGTAPDKATVFFEEGVEVVQNHIKPYVVPGEPRTLVLRRYYSIDTKDDKIAARGLTDIHLFDVDAEGNIYIVRPPAGPGDLVFELSDRGEVARSFGRRGQGPNELEYPNRIFVRGDRIGIVESPKSKITYFDPSGAFSGVVSWKSDIDDLHPLGEDRYLVTGMAKDDRKGRFIPQYVGITDENLESIKELERYSSRPNYPLVGSFPERTINGLGNIFLASAAAGRIYAGNDEKDYEIRVYESDGKLIRKIRKDYKPVAVTEKYREEILNNWEGMPDSDKVFIPANRPPFRGFLGDEDGRLFVMTSEPGEGPKESIFDVFDKAGRLISRKALNAYCGPSGVLALIRRNRLYRVQESGDGYKSLVVDEMVWER